MSSDFEKTNLAQNKIMKSSQKNLNLFNLSEKFDVPQNEAMLENLLSNQDQSQIFDNDNFANPDPPWML